MLRQLKYTKCYCFACIKLRKQIYIQKVNTKINTCVLFVVVTLYVGFICLILYRGLNG
jgi:hypothetical protein